MREKMKGDRAGMTQRFVVLVAVPSDKEGEPDRIEEVKGYITANVFSTAHVYPERDADGNSHPKAGQPHPLAGKLGEVFVKMGKAGDEAALLDQWAISFSRELQYGADVNKLCQKHRYTSFMPAGRVLGIKGIRKCSSPVDLVCHWLQIKFCGLPPDDVESGEIEVPKVAQVAVAEKTPPVVKHYRKQDEPPACEADLTPEEVAALVDEPGYSTCDRCRAVFLIGPSHDEKTKKLVSSAMPVYEPQPMPGVESLESIRDRRNGY